MTTRALVLSIPLTLVLASCGGGNAPSDDAGMDAATCPASCDDGDYCNGVETCAPGTPGADPRGCAPGVAPCECPCVEATDQCVPPCADEDGDGAPSTECGGPDCDDGDRNVFP